MSKNVAKQSTNCKANKIKKINLKNMQMNLKNIQKGLLIETIF